MEAIVRHPETDELPALSRIWKTVFDDGCEADFFDHYFDPSHCIIAQYGDVIAASGFLLPAGHIINGMQRVRCAMIYAVATLPEHRRLGYGETVVRQLISRGHELSYQAIVLCPADDSLFEYYKTRIELRDWFYVFEQKITFAQIHNGCVDSQPMSAARLTRVSEERYGRLREEMLDKTPHIEFDKRAMAYQSLLCEQYGGGLYQIDSADGISCAIVERQFGGAVWIKELLTPDRAKVFDIVPAQQTLNILKAIAANHPADEFLVRMPAEAREQSGSPENRPDKQSKCVRRFGMIAVFDGIFDSHIISSPPPWYGLAFD